MSDTMSEHVEEAVIHEQTHTHSHAHEHEHPHASKLSAGAEECVLTVRSHSGLSGDMLLAGLLYMTAVDEAEQDERLNAILPELAGSVRLVRRQVNQIDGWHAEVSLPHQHEHRTLADITALIAGSGMPEAAKGLATDTFILLAEAEAFVHGKKPEKVHFHEVGALDSILDVCMVCDLFVRLAPSRFIVSPLPISDGSVVCTHGVIPVPPPLYWSCSGAFPSAPSRVRAKR